MRSGGCSSTPELEMDLGVGHVEYRVEQHAAKLGPRHRSSVVELSIRNRAVVGSNPTGGSCSLLARPTLRFLLVSAEPPLRARNTPVRRRVRPKITDGPRRRWHALGIALAVKGGTTRERHPPPRLGRRSERGSGADPRSDPQYARDRRRRRKPLGAREDSELPRRLLSDHP